jgi:hypothetical protein
MSRIAIARLLLAAFALSLMLLPGELWAPASSDLEQEGFDTELPYVEPHNRHLFDPYLILENGTWEACPCLPGTELTISGQDLADAAGSSTVGVPELAGTQVLVDGQPASLYLVTPSQVNFVLPETASPPVANVTLLTDGQERGRDTVGVRSGPLSDSTSVQISEEALRLTVGAGSEPSVHLITTPLSFRASFAATIENQAAEAVPLRVTLWNPRNFSSFDLIFGANEEITAAFVESRGRTARLKRLGSYDLGVPYDVSVEWRRGEVALLSVRGPEGARSVSLPASQAPALFDAYRPSLTLISAGNDGSAAAVLADYRLTLLPARFTTIRVDDASIPPVMLAVVGLGVALLVLPAVRFKPAAVASGVRGGGRRLGRLVAPVRRRPYVAAGILGLGGGYLALNALLFTLGSQPFDMGSQKIWAYISAQYGMTDLYYLSQTATLAHVWNGIPYHEAVFPYNAGMAYYFWTIGKLHLLLFGHASPDSLSLEIAIKSFNLAFMLADAVLVYAIVRHLRPDAKLLPWLGAALLLFNPAFVFDTAVWGETESVPLFFLLGSLLAALKDRPTLAWSLLAGAFLTKQTVLLAVLVLGVYYLVRFPWRRSLEGVSTSLILTALAILPFTLNGYPPSIALDPTLAALWVHGGTGAEKVFQVVSYDAFNIWTLVTLLGDGASGLARFQYPDDVPAFAGMSYHSLANLLFAVSVLGLLGWLLIRRKAVASSPHLIFLAVALVFLIELVLPTRVVSRYFLFPMVFAIFGLTGPSRWLAGLVVASLSLTTLVGSYGSMALVLEDFPVHAPELAPETNAVSAAALHLFRSDIFITVAASLNVLSLIAVTVAVWQGLRRKVVPEGTPGLSEEAFAPSPVTLAPRRAPPQGEAPLLWPWSGPPPS